MADSKITNLTAAGSFLLADELPVNEAGADKKVTGTQMVAAVNQTTGASIKGSVSGYVDELHFATAGAGDGDGISTSATGTPGLTFDHRGTGNTGNWGWRNGTGAANTQATLSNVGLLTLNGGLSTNGHIVSALAGTPSTSALGANVTSVTFTGNDTRGTIAIVMSGALAANTRIATCTYAVSYGATAPILMLANETAGVGVGSINFYRLAVSTGVSFDLASDFALAAGTYTCAYIAIG